MNQRIKGNTIFVLHLFKKKSKRNFFSNLNVKKITDNKSFPRAVKPSFTEKTLKGEKTVLVENDTTFSEEKEVAETFWSHFDGIVDGLNIKRCEISKEHSDPTLNAIRTFEKHPSILKKRAKLWQQIFL